MPGGGEGQSGVLQSMESQRVGHHLATEQPQNFPIPLSKYQGAQLLDHTGRVCLVL